LRPEFGFGELLTDLLLLCFRFCSECLHRAPWSGVYSAGSPASPPVGEARTACGLAANRVPDPVRRCGDRPRDGVSPRVKRMLSSHFIDVEVNRRGVRFSFERCRRGASVCSGDVPWASILESSEGLQQGRRRRFAVVSHAPYLSPIHYR
jgi:hypothetical protein